MDPPHPLGPLGPPLRTPHKSGAIWDFLETFPTGDFPMVKHNSEFSRGDQHHLLSSGRCGCGGLENRGFGIHPESSSNLELCMYHG